MMSESVCDGELCKPRETARAKALVRETLHRTCIAAHD